MIKHLITKDWPHQDANRLSLFILQCNKWCKNWSFYTANYSHRVYMKLSNIWLYASLLGSVFKQSAVEMRAVKRDKNLSLFKVPANFKHTYKAVNSNLGHGSHLQGNLWDVNSSLRWHRSETHNHQNQDLAIIAWLRTRRSLPSPKVFIRFQDDC